MTAGKDKRSCEANLADASKEVDEAKGAGCRLVTSKNRRTVGRAERLLRAAFEDRGMVLATKSGIWP